MRRGFFLLVGVGLLGILSGCRHSSQSSCGCQSPVADHMTPIASPAMSGGATYAPPAASSLAPSLGR